MPEQDLDLGAVGNVARASKTSVSPPKALYEFTVKKGDDGELTVCETYRSTPTPSRRQGAVTGEYKERPFDDPAALGAHVQGLLAQMGGGEVEGGGMRERPGGGMTAPAPRPAAPPVRPAAVAVSPDRVTAATPGAAMTAKRPLY